MKKTVHTVKRAAFTLVELIIVIAIITLLAGIVVVTINPANIFANSRNSQRANDISSIQSAITRFLADSPANPSSTSLARILYGPTTGNGCSNATSAAVNGVAANTMAALCGGGLQSSPTAATSIGLIYGNGTITGGTISGNTQAGTGVYAVTAGGRCSNGSTSTTNLTLANGYKILSSAGDGSTSVDLSNLVSNGYLPKIPVDPSTGNNYRVCIDINAPSPQSNATPGKLVIYAPDAEAVNGVITVPSVVI